MTAQEPFSFQAEALEARQAAVVQLTITDHRNGSTYTVVESSKRNKGEPYIAGRGVDLALIRALVRLSDALKSGTPEEIRMTRR